MGLTKSALPKEEFIYVVAHDVSRDEIFDKIFDQPIKVGVTRQPSGRFRDANTWFPEGILVFACVPVLTRETEFDLHRLLIDYRKERGEWFNFKGDYYCPAAVLIHMARFEYTGCVAPYSTERLIVERLIIEHHQSQKQEVYRRVFGGLPRTAINLPDEFVERSLRTAEANMFPIARKVSDRLLERHSLILKRQNESDWKSPVVYFEAPVIKSLTGGLGYGSA